MNCLRVFPSLHDQPGQRKRVEAMGKEREKLQAQVLETKRGVSHMERGRQLPQTGWGSSKPPLAREPGPAQDITLPPWVPTVRIGWYYGGICRVRTACDIGLGGGRCESVTK